MREHRYCFPICLPQDMRYLVSLVLLLQCPLCYSITIGMLLDLNCAGSAGWTAEFEQKAADLATAFSTTVDLRLYHVNDTTSAALGAYQMLSDNADVVIGTENSQTTNVVRYTIAAQSNHPLMLSWCESADSMTQEDDFFVSMYSIESRVHANVRLATAEAFNHLVVITDKLLDRMPPVDLCDILSVHGTCIAHRYQLSATGGEAEFRSFLKEIWDAGYEVLVVDIVNLWAMHALESFLKVSCFVRDIGGLVYEGWQVAL